MAKSQIFRDCAFAFNHSSKLTGKLVAELSAIAIEHGASILDPRRDGSLPMDRVTHIISNTIDFEQYSEAQAFMIPVVTVNWIKSSIYRNRAASTRPFSPDPRLIFSEVIVTCADLPLMDKESILGACMALGGQESKDASKLTTHICALSMDHPKVQTAQQKGYRVKYVLPHWFDDCFKLGKRIDEKPYLLPQPNVLSLGPEEDLEIPENKNLDGAASHISNRLPLPQNEFTEASRLTVFQNKMVMLASDLNASPRHLQSIQDVIVRSGGLVVDTVDDCDYYIGQYRDGDDYVRAAQSCKHIGNLAWLYHLIVRNEWSNPLHKLLHYPYPRDGIPGLRGLKITVSNYGGESRIYLENLVKACGAEFTKTMTQENTHLITARNSSEKCQVAPEWGIMVVNHFWIEESYAKCELRPVTIQKYTHFPPRTNLTEVAGQVFLDEAKLRSIFYPGEPENATPVGRRKRRILEAAQENAYGPGPVEGLVVSESRKHVAERSAAFGPSRTPSGKENKTPDTTTGGRSAKAKAKTMLRHIAPDIALYEREKKRQSKSGSSPWGGKRAADLVEKEKQTSGHASKPRGDDHNDNDNGNDDDNDNDNDNDDAEELDRPPKKARPSLPEVEMRICITGYARWLGNQHQEDRDRRKLRDLGISITSTGNQACDYLAAPKVVRTVKFLLALSRGPTVVDSSFIDTILDTGKVPKAKDYLLNDKVHEEKYQFSMQKSVARARSNRRKLLAQIPIYCTEKIHNGADSFQAIAEANGAIFKIYRARGSTTIKPTTAEEDGFTSPDPVYLLSSNSADERRIWPKFREMADRGHMEARIVAPDWLLDVAMAQEVRFDEKFLVENYFSSEAR